MTWFHPGGSAKVFFQPAHMADLGEYLRDLPEKTQVEVLGIGSNTCFSSDCLDGVLVYLGARFGGFEARSERTVRVGAGALTGDVVRKAMLHGLDLTFLGAVAGTIGGVIASNASFLGGVFVNVFCARQRCCETGASRPASAMSLSAPADAPVRLETRHWLM